MAIGLVNRAQIIKVDTIVLLDTLNGGSHKAGKIVVTIVLQVDVTATTGIGGQSVLGEINRRRIKECQEIRHATFLGHLQELALSGLLGPIVSAILGKEALGTGAWLYLRIIALLGTTGT